MGFFALLDLRPRRNFASSVSHGVIERIDRYEMLRRILMLAYNIATLFTVMRPRDVFTGDSCIPTDILNIYGDIWLALSVPNFHMWSLRFYSVRSSK